MESVNLLSEMAAKKTANDGDRVEAESLTKVFIVVIFSLVIWKMFVPVTNIVNLVSVDDYALLNALHSEIPSIFHCSHLDDLKDTYSSLFPKRRSKGYTIMVALLNCSRKLPNGHDIFEEYHINRNLHPVIFGTAPWLAAPIQADLSFLKNATTFQNFIDSQIAPRGIKVYSTNELELICGFLRIKNANVKSNTDTCFIILQGRRHYSIHTDLEAAIVQEHPHTKFATLNATTHRLALESGDQFVPSSYFGLKLLALRSDRRYRVMTEPITRENLLFFINKALTASIHEYNQSSQDFDILDASHLMFTDSTRNDAETSAASWASSLFTRRRSV